MTMLTKIGNSKGIRIPKPLIEQAHLEDTQLELEVLKNGLLIKPIKIHNEKIGKKILSKFSLPIKI